MKIHLPWDPNFIFGIVSNHALNFNGNIKQILDFGNVSIGPGPFTIALYIKIE
jgi:hypothetical protein